MSDNALTITVPLSVLVGIRTCEQEMSLQANGWYATGAWPRYGPGPIITCALSFELTNDEAGIAAANGIFREVQSYVR